MQNLVNFSTILSNIQKELRLGKKPSLSSNVLSVIAGFLDGDGSLIAQIIPRQGKTGNRLHYGIRVSVQFTQKATRKIYLQQMQAVLASVNISSTIRERENKGHPVCDLVIANRDDVLKFLHIVGPYISLKAKQAKYCYLLIKSLKNFKDFTCYDMIKACLLVDKVSSFNDSSTARTNTAAAVVKHYKDLGWV